MPLSTIITPWSATLGAGSLPVLPDGCRDLILCISDDGPAKLFLTALDSSPRIVNAQSTSRYVGLRFRPGTQFMWESKKPGIDCDVVLSDKDALIGKWVAQVIRCPQRAEELLLDAAERWGADDTLSTEFINSLVQDGEFGIGERQLRRRIRQQTGKPPNFWRQLYRARVAARNIVSGASPLAIVANDSGYADQAHLSREMRRWFGLSPSLLRATPEQFAQHFNSPDAFSR